jgi:RNA polymerase-binding transcription factor DksA
MYEKEQKKLLKLKKRLKKRVAAVKQALTSRRSKDWEEAAVEAENDEVLVGIFQESSQELLLVNHALQRMKAGEYNNCEECDQEINKKRLKIMPYTTLCIKCAQQLEYKHR